jgi:geranylgeranyl diphosphate synthase type II
VHTYSLIHDDLPAMDDDDLRRGRPTCHIAFGENVAILAGDGLMAEAYRLILERQAGEPARLLAGGKRVRPVLSLATARALGAEPERFLPVACAIELIHTYSLIHDDLPAMDDDELRRGRPTSHVVYGEDVAILAGDGLFAEAIRLFCERQAGAPERVLAALGELAGATGVGGMVGGQYRDVTAGDELDAEQLRELHSLKTGRLIGASVAVPLILAGLTDERMDPYRRFAAELGVLFQIVDDILDVTGSDEELGKPQGSDERHGKLTYVSLFGLDQARELAIESYRNARAALAEAEADSTDLERVTDFIHTRSR